MPYSAISTTQIATAEPTKQELFEKIRTNFEDHETRIATLEAAVTSFAPFMFNLSGPYPLRGSSQTGVLYERVPFDCTLTAARLLIWTAGTAGTTEVNVLYKRGVAAYTTIFTTRPSVAFGAGDGALSSNAVLGVTDLEANDLLRMDITGVQTGGAHGLTLYLEFTK